MNQEEYHPEKQSEAWLNEIQDEYEIPETLFHYTDMVGGREILEKRVIWATYFEHLNDRSEVKHGMALATKLFEVFRARTSIVSNYFDLVLKFLKTESSRPTAPPFIFSCTVHGDQLSQWRGYADSGRGVCVGLNPKSLGVFVMKVIYDQTEKERQINNTLIKWERMISEMVNNSPQKELTDIALQRDIVRVLVTTLLVQACRFKDISFEEEAEWRLVYFNKRAELKFRPRGNEIVMYIDIQMNNQDNCAISSVRLGPRSNGNQEFIFEQMKAVYGFNGPISRSAAPLI